MTAAVIERSRTDVLLEELQKWVDEYSKCVAKFVPGKNPSAQQLQARDEMLVRISREFAKCLDEGLVDEALEITKPIDKAKSQAMREHELGRADGFIKHAGDDPVFWYKKK